MSLSRKIATYLWLALWAVGSASAVEFVNTPDPAEFARRLLASPAGEMDFARAKISVDRYVDPTVDARTVLSSIEAIAGTAQRMIADRRREGLSTESMAKLDILRTVIYEPGYWNNGRPFEYDLTDPMGQNQGAQLLSVYLATRKGNCVSMPILFLAVGERLGLDLTLSIAPLHLFVKYTDDPSGLTYNLETSSGAGFTRDVWYRRKLPMTDKAIANGVYLKTLSRQETLAVIATPLLDHLLARGRYEEAIAVADVLLEAYPALAYALVKKGTAYHRLLEDNFIRRYPQESDIPQEQISYATALLRANRDAFAQAEALGWRMPNLD